MNVSSRAAVLPSPGGNQALPTLPWSSLLMWPSVALEPQVCALIPVAALCNSLLKSEPASKCRPHGTDWGSPPPIQLPPGTSLSIKRHWEFGVFMLP